MAIRIIDENGIYREVDPKTGLFVDEHPLASNMGQVEHQYVTTNKGNITDPDDFRPDVIDGDTGLAVLSEDETKIKQFIKSAISVDNLVATFNDNSHETLLKLLALQDNKHPLKKGGIGVAYRTDALIMHCKMEFTADENIVFDAILGTMSSLPEDTTYRIEPSSFLKHSKFENENYLYDVFRRGADKLKERHLKFEELGPDGDDDIIVPWFDILRYHKKNKKNDVAFIEFKPSDFFKDLALCSQLVHGAYGSLEVTTQLRGKYTIALYWFLENKKRYKEYATATPGQFEISIEEFKHQFSIPQGYCKADIERRVLTPAYESINNVAECDFTFEYEDVYTGKRHVGYRFRINSKNYIETKAVEVIEIEKDPLEDQIKSFMALTGVAFNDSEISQMYKMAKKYDRDAAFIMQTAGVLKSRLDNTKMEPIDNPFAYILTLIKNGTLLDPTKAEKDYKAVKNNFTNYSQRDYDFDELEKLLLK